MQTAENFNQFKFLEHILECEKALDVLIARRFQIARERQNLEPLSFEETTMYTKSLKKQNLLSEKKYPKENKKNFEKAKENVWTLIPITFIGGGIISIIYGLKEMFSDVGHGLLGGLGVGITSALGLLAIFMVIAVLISIFLIVNGKLKDKKENENARAQVDEYNKEIKKKNEIIYTQNAQMVENCKLEYKKYLSEAKVKQSIKEPILTKELEKVKEKINEYNKVLDMLYSLKINGVWCLHPNYRGLEPVSILYGYFETGRCTQLQGHEGAYNLYEDEKLKGIIISKVDDISRKLDMLNATMYYVGMAVNEVGRKVRELSLESSRVSEEVLSLHSSIRESSNEMRTTLSNRLSAIEENTANSAYYSEIGAKAASYTAMYHFLNQ